MSDKVNAESAMQLRLLETNVIVTKADIVSKVKDAVLSGDYEAAKIGVVLKRVKEGIEEALKDDLVKDAIRQDTEKYIEKGKTANILGAKVTVMATYTTYNFQDCGDSRLMKLYELQKDIDTEIKSREDRLKLLLKEQEAKQNKGKFGIDALVEVEELIKTLPAITEEETGGEVATLKPPVKIQNIGLKYLQI